MSLRFSVTQPPEFELRQVPMIPGTNVMSGSVINEQIKDIINQQSGINKVLSPQQQLQLYLDQEGGGVETDVFKNRNVFQKSFDFLKENPAARLGLGALIGGPIGALTGLFANKIGGGILDAITNFRNRGKDVELGIPQVIQTGSEFVDEFAPSNDPGTVGGSSYDSDTGGTFGSSTNDASTFSDYS
jgi:hypothetical protein|tara:strand:+ start:45 stop:605 length:561 start_codon:yes stop_codon:yes gene_type:complete